MDRDNFLQRLIIEKASETWLLVFLERFSEENKDKKEFEIESIIYAKFTIEAKAYRRIRTKIYDIFTNDCPELKNIKGPGKSKLLREWLENKFQEAQSQLIASASKGKDWDGICRAMLDNQQQMWLTSNSLLGDRKDTQFPRQKIFVPLALVPCTEPTERSDQFSSANETSQDKPLKHKDFSDKFSSANETSQNKPLEHKDFINQIVIGGQGINSKRIAIIGEPGAGKTTTLQDIAYKILAEKIDLSEQQQSKIVVIYVSLAELQERSLEKYLLQDWLKEALSEKGVTPEWEDELIDLFKSGRVWLLLDGVDKMASGEPRQALQSQLKGWVALAQMILTCRVNVWEASVNSLANFEAYRLLDFDYPQQVRSFVDKFFESSNPAKGNRLKEELDVAAWLQDLVRNPLRLVMLCSIWLRREGKLPQNRAGLYHEFMQQFYNWKKPLFSIRSKKQNELNRALGDLSIKNIEQGSSPWLQESFICDELGAPDDENSLFHLALKLGWLSPVDNPKSEPKEKVYAFFHRTFEEYFAALAINNWYFFLYHIPGKPQHSKVSYRIFEPQWKEVILLWLGRKDVQPEQKEALIQALVEFDDGCGDFYNRRAYLLAAEGIAEFKDYSRADGIVKQIVDWCLHRDFCIQKELWEIFAVFSKTDRKRAIYGLNRIVDESQSEYIRLHAAGNLGGIDKGNSKAICTLVALIKNSQDEFIPGQAAHILGEIVKGNSTAIDTAIDALLEALVDLIQNSPQSSNIFWGIALVLKEIAEGNLKAIKKLELLIDRSQSEDINFDVASILGSINKGNPTAIRTLLKLIRKPQTSRNAANSLERNAKGNSVAIEDLVKLVNDNSQPEDTRQLAAEILGQIAEGDSTAEKALASLIDGNSQPKNIHLQWQAVLSLEKIDKGNFKANDTLAGLIRNLQSENTPSKFLLFVDSDNPEVNNALLELLQNSPDKHIRWQAAISLGKTGSDKSKVIEPKVIDTLANLIHESQDKSFIWLIGNIFRETGERYPTIIYALESLAQNSHQPEDIRLQAAKSLIEINAGYSTVIDTLAFLAQHSLSRNVRIDAAQSLVEIDPGNSIAINTLVSSAENYPSNDIRRHGMVVSLGRVSERTQIEEVFIKYKNYLSNRSSENDFRQHMHWYEIIWHCAQTLPYPTFYQAWHSSPHTPYHEVPEISGVNFTPVSQSLNLAYLPEQLRAALDSDSSLEGIVQLTCINGSDFLDCTDCNDLAIKVYNEMRLQHCPQYKDDELTTMVQLQDYWDRLKRDRDHTYILVFYESRISLERFRDKFLDDLSKFDGAICVISNQLNLPLQSLQFFSPNHLNLVADVVEWVKSIVLKNS